MHASHKGAKARQSHSDEEKSLKDRSESLKAQRQEQRDNVDNEAYYRNEKLKIPELRTRRASGQCRVLQKAAGDGILKGQKSLPCKRSERNAARAGTPGPVRRSPVRHLPGVFSRIRTSACNFSFRRNITGRTPPACGTQKPLRPPLLPCAVCTDPQRFGGDQNQNGMHNSSILLSGHSLPFRGEQPESPRNGM